MSKIQIRRNCFETNSSSVHSLTIVSNDDYKKWINNEVFYNSACIAGYGKFMTPEEVFEAIKANKLYVKEEITKILTMEDILAVLKLERRHVQVIEFEEDVEILKNNLNRVATLYNIFKEAKILTYATFEFQEYETFAHPETLDNGTKVVAFGYYGYDG